MNIVSVESLTKSYEEKRLFTQISFGIAERERVGLIGVNGSGKSTLLQTVAGLVPPDEGAVTVRSGLTVEYLAQNPQFDPSATVLDTIFQGDSPSIRGLRDYEQALADLAGRPGDARLQARLADLQLQMDARGLWSLEAQAKSILTRLGIADFGALAGTLSGGQRKRVAMARALIQPADLLILDEPTNHIDNETVGWLEEYLSRFTGALLLVTHDRYFLDRVVGRILELDGGRLYSFAGNYGDYLEAKAARDEAEVVREEKRQNLLRRELAWLRRGAKARSTKQKARIQRVEALQEDRPEARDGALEIAVGSHRLGKQIIEIKHVAKSFDERTLIRDFEYTVLPGDRVGIIGPNGSGKSTLLNLIAGRLAPDAGEVVMGQTVRLAYYDQESGYMDPEQRVIDYIKAVAEVVQTPDGGTITASQMLERFLFPPRVQYTLLGKLSGGERRRLYLLRTLMSEPNVLLLDEPTNDLDIQTLTILEDYLDQFPGVVIAVSHDRYFLDRVAEHLFAFEGDGRIRRYVGGYSDYLEERAQAEAAVPARVTEAAPVAAEPARAPKQQLKFTFKEQREFETIEDDIAQVEAKLAALAKAVEEASTDYTRLQALAAEQAEAEAELSRKLDRWTELTELAEAIERQKAERQAGR
ncbi:MAG TPA: ABC-F family ATP-binding cassette domain-containing protein [Symbiobacteriaceae bacterium]|nr:ABC-F family ATP-binding cassette domain-containing protein [Symbiobacteriaceae bacterium]